MDLPAASSKEPKGIGLEDTPVDEKATEAAEDQVDAAVAPPPVKPAAAGGGGGGGLSPVDLSPISRHELNPQERKTAHRLVATSMLVTVLVIGLSQGWWQHVRDWITEKTHGPVKATPGGGGGADVGFTP